VHDLVVRRGLLVDGSGAPPRPTDVAVADGIVVEVGQSLGPGRREIDAGGLVVTPGFVDPHTHYDGQATWDPVLAPSSNHGVTSVVMGNCGVGFAPVAADRHDWLIGMMEGVEDIPGTALAEGLPWDWGTFPEYLDSLERRTRVIDIGTHVPHAALRAFVMGDRGADPLSAPATDELDRMRSMVEEGLDAGAVGVSTSRTEVHRTRDGENLGTLRAGTDELVALADALFRRRRGVFQLVSDSYRTQDDSYLRAELALIGDLARASRRPVSFTVQQSNDSPERWREQLAAAVALRDEGFDVKAQVAPRPIGVLLGLQASLNPFTPTRAYRRIASLPLDERVAAMGDPEIRRKIIEGHAALTGGPDAFSGLKFLGRFEDMYVLDDPVNYAPDASRSLGAQARLAGREPAEFVYDLLLAGGGRQLLYAPSFNFTYGNMAVIREMITSPVALFGLSDAGAHCGAICDASMPTSFLSIWARDRATEDGLPLESVVHHLTRRPAEHVGWLDRGLLAPGHVADLNVIDLDALGCRPPEIVSDLPAGGRRLVQRATGYRFTVKQGLVTFVDGEHTGELPGGLVRGQRAAPVGAR
jgi:N-acyl-D-amino-acid deacylase